MAKIELKGIVKSVGDIEFIGQNNTPKQTLIIFKGGYVDEYGEKKGRDEYWPIDVIGNRVETFNINETWLDKKVEAEIYVTGNGFQKKDGTGMGFTINANLASIKQFSAPVQQPANTTPVDVNATPGEDDDLPF